VAHLGRAVTVTTEAHRVDGWWLVSLAVGDVRVLGCMAPTETEARLELPGLALSRAEWLEATAAQRQAECDAMTARAKALRSYAAKAAGGG
jgi:hypothetical protein